MSITVEQGDVRIVVHRLRYKDRLFKLTPFIRKHLGDAPEDTDDVAQALYTARWNFIKLSTHGEVQAGDVILALPSDSAEVFEDKLNAFIDLDDALVFACVDAINAVDEALGGAHTAPVVAENADPNSDRSAPSGSAPSEMPSQTLRVVS